MRHHVQYIRDVHCQTHPPFKPAHSNVLITALFLSCTRTHIQLQQLTTFSQRQQTADTPQANLHKAFRSTIWPITHLQVCFVSTNMIK